MSTHPEELKAEDGNNMARGDGLEWGLTALQQFSQVDVGQRSTKKREQERGVEKQRGSEGRERLGGLS